MGMKVTGRKIVLLCLVSIILSCNVLFGQSGSLEHIGSPNDTLSFYDRFLREQQVYDSLDQIEIARYDSIYRAERDSLDYCDPEVEQFYDGLVHIEAGWIDSISRSCLWVHFEPRFMPPTPYILTVDKQRYDIDLHWYYWDNVYDNKRYTGIFVVCLDKCMTDTKQVLITAFIPYTSYVAYLILE